ncbi:MAG: flagellar basal body L-ring protein [Rhodobacteraceae bacterium GWE1_64_9]|nr:MAG: flagellar basal body L-ring protein [Rhodobacteraceae bacterium GWE1_64_9]OHC50942.1 MAG: flagellar basal body L-ring protein [Rhodobacteraceae bacterium GWF1_65_7]HBD90489.1 flagellar basal body L-ring protein [Gemmobacter sp.]HBU15359.1 flagellar basal body L-ring protein [Gemmobacter sp.]
MQKTILLFLGLCACGRLETIGEAPDFTPLEGSYQHHAMYSTALPRDIAPETPAGASSLWTADRMSLFGEQRAGRRGDILTVVIEIDDSAEISNASGRDRAGRDSMGMPALFGIPQRLNERLPEGASMAEAVETGSSSSYAGSGSVSRNEKLTLRVAATVVEELANGVLRIEGIQEVRVNFELRELSISGYVRPADISRRNEITYDKIAGAHISYGGRGQITDVQQPRYGQQIADVILPF